MEVIKVTAATLVIMWSVAIGFTLFYDQSHGNVVSLEKWSQFINK